MSITKNAIFLSVLAVLGACRDRVRIHTEAPRVTMDEVVSCTYHAPGFGCGLGFDGKYSCGKFVMNAPHSGHQHARVTRTTYSWNYADAKPDELPQGAEDVDVTPLESCR